MPHGESPFDWLPTVDDDVELIHVLGVGVRCARERYYALGEQLDELADDMSRGWRNRDRRLRASYVEALREWRTAERFLYALS